MKIAAHRQFFKKTVSTPGKYRLTLKFKKSIHKNKKNRKKMHQNNVL